MSLAPRPQRWSSRAAARARFLRAPILVTGRGRAEPFLQTDNELVLRDLCSGVAQALGVHAVPEALPAYEPQSNEA
eukprot:11500390-Alexandrium_andersonii.AAC.1